MIWFWFCKISIVNWVGFILEIAIINFDSTLSTGIFFQIWSISSGPCFVFVYSFLCYSHHNMRQYDTNEAVAKNIKTARTKNILYICMYHVSVSVTEMLRLDTNLDWSFHCFFLLLHSSSLSPEFKYVSSAIYGSIGFV